MSVTRRSVLAAAGAALPALAQQAVKLPKKVRLAMHGLDGHTAEILDPLPELPDVEFVALSGTAKDIARPTKNKYLAAAHKYTSLREMLDREKPDVVAVCNNNAERAPAILEVARRGLHVIAEKPLAISRTDYNKVKSTVRSSGSQISLLLPMRFFPHFAALREIVASGAIGDVIQVSAQKSYKAGKEEWRHHRETYGSTILWIGIHSIDLMRWTSGRELVDATAWQNRVGFPELGDQENVSASVFRLDNGGLAILRMDYLRPQAAPTHEDDRVRLAGSKGVAEYTASTGVTLITAKDGPRTITTVPRPGSVLIDFLEGIYNGKPRNVTEQDVWRVNEITLAAHESAAQGAKTLRI